MKSATLERDIRALTKGSCFFDPETLERYSTDRCWYKVTPLCVVQPVSADEVSALAAYCSEHEIPIIPRGAATGLAGQAVGMGVVVDFTASMKSIRALSDSTVSVQPGMVLASLNASLNTRGRFFPIDPASGSECTIGGMIGTNAAGAHGVKYGATKDHVRSLRIVLANGEQIVVDHPVTPDPSVNPAFSGIQQTLDPLLSANAGTIRRAYPDVRKNSSGYNLKDAAAGKAIDYRKLIIGSEGTLAIVVEAELAILPEPAYRLGALISLQGYEHALDATLLALELDPAAVELLDHTYVSLVKGYKPSTDRLIKDDARVFLSVEFEGDVLQDLQQSIMKLNRTSTLAHPIRFLPLTTKQDLQDLWELRNEASRIINAGTGRKKASFIEDVAVPVNRLPEYITGLGSILRAHDIPFCLYGHAGTGNIHCATFVDLTDLRYYKLVDRVATEVYDLAIELGGTLSGEHGDGFVRTPFLERLYGSEVFGLFRRVKQAFDPKGILNPGKITGDQHVSILHDLDLA